MPILDWVDKDKALKAADGAPYRLLEEVPEFSCGDADNENMLIQGDNLDALKALIPYYAGRVKCIFIDPPYNTGSAFEHYDDNLQHSEWLSLMYPRLELLRDLLAEDGTIWITIDDDEAHYLKVMGDEVFGRKNFFGAITWQHSVQGKNDAKTISLHHNYVIVYRKSENFQRNKLPRTEEHNVNYGNPDNDPKGDWRSGDVRSPNLRENLRYSVTTPGGKIIDPPAKGWRWSQEAFNQKVLTGEITFVDNETRVLRKIYLAEQDGRVPESIWLGNDVGTTREATGELSVLFQNSSIFATPKPERLIERIITIATNSGDLVLDSFLGSGTTASVAHKMGRKYIGIELGDHAVTHCVPRLQKVIDGEQGGISKACNWNGGGGFRFFRLGKPVFDEAGQIHPDIKFSVLAAHVWFSETHTPWAGRKKSPLLGVHNGVAYYLLYNGILGERSQSGGNVLTSRVLAELPPHDGAKVIYGEWTPFKPERLRDEKILFKQTPYDVKAR